MILDEKKLINECLSRSWTQMVLSSRSGVSLTTISKAYNGKPISDVAEFANNSYQTEYTLMMHKYADLDKRERSLKIKQRVANWMLFASVILTIGCLVVTAYVCNVIQSIRF